MTDGMKGCIALLLGGFGVLAGCAPETNLVQHGNMKLQFTQTQNQWADNVVAVTQCEKLQNGFCPPDAPTQVFVTSGKMPQVVSGVGHDITAVTSSLIIRDGLKKSKADVKQSNTTDVRASTVNPK